MVDYTELKNLFKAKKRILNDAIHEAKNRKKWRNRLSDFKGKPYSEKNFMDFLKLPMLSEVYNYFEILKIFYEYAKKVKSKKCTVNDVLEINSKVRYVAKEYNMLSLIDNYNLGKTLELICCELRDRACTVVEKESKSDAFIEEKIQDFNNVLNIINTLDSKFTNSKIIGEITKREYSILYDLVYENNLKDSLNILMSILGITFINDSYDVDGMFEESNEPIVQVQEENNTIDVLNIIKRKLEKIVVEFKRIAVVIYKMYDDMSLANREALMIRGYIDSITNDSFALIDMIRKNNSHDEQSISLLNNQIIGYEKIIEKYRNIGKTEETQENIDEKNNAVSNLVFCINDDINLSNSDFQDEYLDVIRKLESINIDVLCRLSSRNGLSRLRKPTEYNDEIDLVSYLQREHGKQLNFIPYRYRGNANCRTGIIKFEPSEPVKEFLMKKYNISKQGAVFGIFEIISVNGADHSEYSILRNYVINNVNSIITLASLFRSNEPDLMQLEDIINKMLTVKKEKQEYAKKMLSGGQK